MYTASFCCGIVGEPEACIAPWPALAHPDRAIATSKVAEIRVTCDGAMLVLPARPGGSRPPEVLHTRDTVYDTDRNSVWEGGKGPPKRSRRSLALELEGHLDLGPVALDFAIFEHHVQLRDLGDAKVAQRFCRLLDRGARCLLP